MVRRYYRAHPGEWFWAVDVMEWIPTQPVPLSTTSPNPVQAIRLVMSRMAARGELIRTDAGYQPPAAVAPETAGQLALE